MSKKIRNKKELQKRLFGTLTDEKDIWENDPVFVKKAQEAKEFIERVGLPEELTTRKACRK